MFTRDERRALVFLGIVIAAGAVLRVVRARADAPGAPIVAPDLPAGDLAKQARLARQALEATRPLMPGERVDLDTASAQQIERLPRVGPQLARRIVDEREAHGPFGSLEGLKRVSGIGPGTLKGFERTTSFSGTPLPAPEPTGPPGLSVTGPLSLNGATAADLAQLPGVGPSLAGRIVTWRTAHGGFREIKELEQVPGIGPTRRQRLEPLLRVP